jgi:succinoglycan biosynthesis transport protein ExoP
MPNPENESKDGMLIQTQRYWHIFLKWKWVAFIVFFASVGVMALFSFLVTPTYTAHGSVWIEDEPNILPFEDVQRFDSNSYLQSHSRLLLSRALAGDTINKLKLYENPDFMGKLRQGKTSFDPANPIFREKLIERFLRSVKVEPIQGTRLVDVRFSSRNPQFATDTLNALFDGYIDMIVKQRYRASEQASDFLNTQIVAVRTEIEEYEKKLNKYGTEKDILPPTATEAPTVSRLSEINQALTSATLDRINKLTYYNQIKSAPLGDIPEATNDSLIIRLREQYSALSREYAKRLATVKPEYPEMQRLKSELDSTKEALQNETLNLINTAYSAYETALRKEQSLERLLEEQKREAFKANSDSVFYNSLKIELDNKKALLESLSRRQSQTDISSRLQSLEALNVWIVDRADYPLKPAFPNKLQNILLGILMGLGGGLGFVILIEFMNQTVKTSKDVSSATGLATLGVIPSFDERQRSNGLKAEISRLRGIFQGTNTFRDTKSRRQGRNNTALGTVLGGDEHPGNGHKISHIELIALREPQSIQAESYRSIRTTLLVSSPPGRIKSIIFTSPLAKEGKSSTVSNLGVTLAEGGKKVVIVDSDLRKPKQSKIFGLNSGPGLSRYLSTSVEYDDLLRPSHIPNVFLVNSGPLPVNPIELLTSEKMDDLVAHLKRDFDYTLLDTPPLLAVSDALAMGVMADTIIIVGRGGVTPIQALKQAKQKLDAHKLKCLGIILNDVDLLEQDGYYAKQYYHYAKVD